VQLPHHRPEHRDATGPSPGCRLIDWGPPLSLPGPPHLAPASKEVERADDGSGAAGHILVGDQQQLLCPGQLLQRCLPAQGGAAAGRRLAKNEQNGTAAPRVRRRQTAFVLAQPPRQIAGGAGVQRAIGAAQHVDRPAAAPSSPITGSQQGHLIKLYPRGGRVPAKHRAGRQPARLRPVSGTVVIGGAAVLGVSPSSISNLWPP